MTRLSILSICGFAVLAGCAEEPPPRSVSEFVENPILLEAAMVRCSQDRSQTKYDPECVNARQAVARIQVKEEAKARAEFEARSESKRAALRRTQAAAAEARRRAEEARRKREEAEYLAQFGVLPPNTESNETALDQGNLPVAVIPEAQPEMQSDVDYEQARPGTQSEIVYEEAPPAEVENVTPSQPEAEAEPTDLGSIRDELRRRNEDGGF